MDNKFKNFGIMIDCSRNAVRNLDSLKKFMDYMKLMDYNMLQLYIEDTFEVDNEPKFGYLRGRYSQEELRELNEYAKSKNVYTIATDFFSPEIKKEKKAADEYWMIDVADFEALKMRCIEEGVTNIYAGNHEFCLDQCKRLCQELGFPFYASDAGWTAARDKGLYKEECRKAGLLTPRQY